MPWKITTPDGREYAADRIYVDPDAYVVQTVSKRGASMELEVKEFTVEWVDE